MRRKLHYSTRRCCLCDTIIADEYVVCREHMEDYRRFGGEEWFKMCVASQRRQFEIDQEELFLANGAIKNTKPYRKLTESEKYAIRYLRKKGLGARSIGKVLGISEKTIERFIYSKPKNSN